MQKLSDSQAKKILAVLVIAQIAFVLSASYFGGHAMLFCAPKSSDCNKTAEYLWNNRIYSVFASLWLISIASTAALAIICSSNYRQKILSLLLTLPVIEYFSLIFLLMAGF